MANNKPSLILFTISYPFGKGESFLENEISVLAEYFQLTIVPVLRPLPGEKRTIPAGVDVVLTDNFSTKSVHIILKNAGWIVSVLWNELKSNQGKRFYIVRNSKNLISQLLNLLKMEDAILLSLKNKFNGEVYGYSYWANLPALLFSRWKKKSLIQSWVTRIHGFDLYDERHPGNYAPFRSTIVKSADAVFPVGEYGKSYLLKRYSKKEINARVFNLGTQDYGMGPIPPKVDVPVLVSCSHALPLKRLELLAKSLAGIDFPLVWHHFGDGPTLTETKKMASANPQVNAIFHGMVDNAVVMEFYQKNPVHMVVLLSQTEGLPVNLMEAASFGIPLLATNVGGVGEIVTSQTGELLPPDPEPEQVRQAIIKLLSSTYQDLEFREGIRNYWKNNFHATENYHQFAQFILRQL